jgi:hypothetical protein
MHGSAAAGALCGEEGEQSAVGKSGRGEPCPDVRGVRSGGRWCRVQITVVPVRHRACAASTVRRMSRSLTLLRMPTAAAARRARTTLRASDSTGTARTSVPATVTPPGTPARSIRAMNAGAGCSGSYLELTHGRNECVGRVSHSLASGSWRIEVNDSIRVGDHKVVEAGQVSTCGRPAKLNSSFSHSMQRFCNLAQQQLAGNPVSEGDFPIK